jgi:hypothetical protein
MGVSILLAAAKSSSPTSGHSGVRFSGRMGAPAATPHRAVWALGAPTRRKKRALGAEDGSGGAYESFAKWMLSAFLSSTDYNMEYPVACLSGRI